VALGQEVVSATGAATVFLRDANGNIVAASGYGESIGS